MSTVTLTLEQANGIADALLAGCFLTTEAERTATCDLSRASALNTHNALRDAMLLLEGRIALAADPDRPTHGGLL